jgi:hypothetical protein
LISFTDFSFLRFDFKYIYIYMHFRGRLQWKTLGYCEKWEQLITTIKLQCCRYICCTC